jgi:hypothetical protein
VLACKGPSWPEEVRAQDDPGGAGGAAKESPPRPEALLEANGLDLGGAGRPK